MNARLAIIVIGRNEGPRLPRCLEPIAGGAAPVIYVDSGSADGSAELARGIGVEVVELDAAVPFTAARARNEGLARVAALHPEVERVQFLDGDCELVSGWLERGVCELSADPRLAVAFGRVRERERERSVYNLLCDLEWRGPANEARSSGGNAMMRVQALREVGGFDAGLIAGEEPELALRLRRAGWRIVRLDADMVLHDAAMTRFAQWWRRALRAGWAYAEGASLHAGSPERHWVRENASILFWGALLPGAALLFAWPTRGATLLLFGGHALLCARIHARGVRLGLPGREARLQALFTVLGKLPQALGQLQFAALRLLGRRRRVIDWRVAG
jgi:GT2 family glycosyltransferase